MASSEAASAERWTGSDSPRNPYSSCPRTTFVLCIQVRLSWSTKRCQRCQFILSALSFGSASSDSGDAELLTQTVPRDQIQRPTVGRMVG